MKSQFAIQVGGQPTGHCCPPPVPNCTSPVWRLPVGSQTKPICEVHPEHQLETPSHWCFAPLTPVHLLVAEQWQRFLPATLNLVLPPLPLEIRLVHESFRCRPASLPANLIAFLLRPCHFRHLHGFPVYLLAFDQRSGASTHPRLARPSWTLPTTLRCRNLLIARLTSSCTFHFLPVHTALTSWSVDSSRTSCVFPCLYPMLMDRSSSCSIFLSEACVRQTSWQP